MGPLIHPKEAVMRFARVFGPCVLLWAALGVSAQAQTIAPTPVPLRYTVEDLQGHALLLTQGGASLDLKEGMELAPGEEVRTAEGAQVVLMVNDETSLQVGPLSRVKLTSLAPTPQGGFLSRFLLLGGRILAQVQKLSTTRSSFEIEAGGLVCGVRGTAFEMELSGEDLEARTHEGEVAVTRGDRVESVRAGNVCAFRGGLLRMRRRLDRVEMERFSKWKAFRLAVRDKRLRRLQDRRSLQKQDRPLRHERLKERRSR